MQKEKSTGSSVSTSDVPPSHKCPCVHSLVDKSSFFSLAKKEIKMLDFKTWKGTASIEEM
jgi:hypothetical protein